MPSRIVLESLETLLPTRTEQAVSVWKLFKIEKHAYQYHLIIHWYKVRQYYQIPDGPGRHWTIPLHDLSVVLEETPVAQRPWSAAEKLKNSMSA